MNHRHKGAALATAAPRAAALGMPRLCALTASFAFLALGVADLARSAPSQPYLETIGAPTIVPTLQPVVVGVLDAGIDSEHPDLAGRIVGSRRFGAGDPLFPRTAHGTATAGLIAAIRNNSIGIDGVAPNALLLSADVSRSADPNTFSKPAINNAIYWAVDRGARVLSLSLKVEESEPGLRQAINYAISKGVLVVAAGGNCWDGVQTNWRLCDEVNSGVYPAWLPHVLGVGATNANYLAPSAADFSIPSARYVDVAAPGSLITTLWPTRNNPYHATPRCPHPGTTACYSSSSAPWGVSGTSYSTPMVAAAAAILFGANPALQPDQVIRLLETTARPLDDPQRQLGAGVLDIQAALSRVASGRLPPADSGEPNELPARPASLPPSGSAHATIDWFNDPSDSYRFRLPAGEHGLLRTKGGRAEVKITSLLTNTVVNRGPLGETFRLGDATQAVTYQIDVTADAASRTAYTIRASESRSRRR